MSGIIPAPVSFSELQLVQHFSTVIKPGAQLATVEVSRSLKSRRLFCYVFAQSTAAASLLSGRIDVFSHGSKVSEIPFFAGQNNPLSKPLFSPFVSGGVSAGNAIFLQPPFSQLLPATSFSPAESEYILLQPFELSGEVDKFSISIQTVTAVTGGRVVFVCESSQ